MEPWPTEATLEAAATAAEAVELLPRQFAAAAAAAVAGCVGASSWLSPLLPLPELSIRKGLRNKRNTFHGTFRLLISRRYGVRVRVPDFIGQICSKYFKTPMGFWKSRLLPLADAEVDALESSECSIRTGPKQMAKFWGVILLRSDWAVTRHKWSISRNKVVYVPNSDN